MPPLGRTILENALCLALLAAVAAAAFFPALAGDKAPADTGGILFYPPWEEARPEGLVDSGAAQPQTQCYYPWFAFLADSARRGELPLWNPYEGCGTPFFALWRTRCLSPFSIPFLILPAGMALGLSAFLKLLTAGLCAFYAARKFGFSPALALFAATAFELSGHVFLAAGQPLSDVIVWLPLLALFTERLALGQGRYWPAGAVILAVMLLGGSPETVAAALVFCALFLVVRLLGERRAPAPFALTLVVFLFTAAAAVGIAAVQIVPFIEFTSEASPSLWPDGGPALRLSDTVLWFLPNFFGGPDASIPRGGETVSGRVLNLMHAGLIQVLLIPLWFAVRRFAVVQQRRRIEAMLSAAAAMTALACGAGAFLSGLPWLRQLGPEHYLAANALVFAFLAAAAAEEWLALDPDEAGAAIKRLCLTIPVLIVFAAAALLPAILGGDAQATPLFHQLVTAGVFAALLLALLIVTLLKPSARIMGYGASALTVTQLLLAFSPGVTFLDRGLIFPETSFITSLKETGARVCGSAALRRWPLAGNLVPQVYGGGKLQLKRHQAFLERVEQDPLLVRRMGAPALLLTKEDIQGAFAPVRPMLKIRRVFSSGAVLFDDLGMKPRAWMAYEWRNVDSFDPVLLSSSLPPLVEGTIPAAGSLGAPLGAPASVPAFFLKPAGTDAGAPGEPATRITIHVDDTPPGLLVLADAYYPGWKAKVDGIVTPILPVDGLFRGVPLAQGTHDVEFYYDPFSLRLGLYISMGALALTALGMARLLLTRPR